MPENTNRKPKQGPGILPLIKLLKPYTGLVIFLVIFTILANGINLVIPRLIANGIDAYTRSQFNSHLFWFEFAGASMLIFIFTYLQSVVQVYTSEKAAKDLRRQLINKISLQSNDFVEKTTSAKLLTNLTSDVDSVKLFVAYAISSIISSFFMVIGASILLLMINWKLGLATLGVLPIILATFAIIFSRVRKLFKISQETIDWLNRVINESILGAALIRLLNTNNLENDKFFEANTEAKRIGLSILRLFATLIPVVTFCTNLTAIIILAFGGHLIIVGEMTLGNFTAFYNYILLLIMPVLIIGIMSNFIAQASASYGRIEEVLKSKDRANGGKLEKELHGDIEVKNLSITSAGKEIVKNVSLTVRAGTKTAILGPTAAGKTQLLYSLVGLLEPTQGEILFDGHKLSEYNKDSLHAQVGFVFQDSILFNLTIKENIAFNKKVSEEAIRKAIETAELADFADALPEKLQTVVSERGTSLSGGQKQRIMLARALALEPKILILDDFTARVDTATEKKILENVARNYSGLTLISVSQKITPIKNYDQIILLMEGEILAVGTHEELMKSSPEYVQIYNSQQSTTHYELPT